MGIQEDLKDIKEELVGDKNKDKQKKFRFPFGKKVGRSQKKKNYVTVLLINENGIYDFKKYQITEQTILHDLIPRLATTGHVMFNKKGNPLVIIPNWSVEAFSPKKHFEEGLSNGSNKKGFQILMSKMKSEQIGTKKSIGNLFKWLGGLALIGIIIYAVLTSGGV